MSEIIDAINVRGLTRGEIKALRKEGFPLETVGTMDDFEKRDEGLDKIFAIASPDADPDSLTQGQALELWAKVVAATYGGADLAKKFKSPLQSTSPAGSGGSSAKSAKKRTSKGKGTARKSRKKNG